MVKINRLEVENLKRIKACTIEPAENGLTVIGGNNGQGKTSTLDAIAWALGGDRFRPSNPIREGAVIPPSIKVTLSNGLLVERTGKNSSLKVTDMSGHRSGQQLLNDFVEQLALNLPKFMNSTSKEKASALLNIIGLGPQLTALERSEKELYDRRLMLGREADRKAKYAQEMPFYPGMPDQPVSVSELISQQQEILARNGENQRKRQRAAQLEREQSDLQEKIVQLTEQLAVLQQQYDTVCADCAMASKSAAELVDESTAELEANILEIDEVNTKVRANLDRSRAQEEASHYQAQYDALSDEIAAIRQKKMALLDNAPLPLPGLSVEDGALIYNGAQWDCMSGADQLRVATAIVRALNPQCGFVLLDKLEQMDLQTLHDFGTWLEAEGLQVIATRVSTGDECSIIIEDGCTVDVPRTVPSPALRPWQGGVF